MKYNKKHLNNKKYKLKSSVSIKRGGASSNTNENNNKNTTPLVIPLPPQAPKTEPVAKSEEKTEIKKEVSTSTTQGETKPKKKGLIGKKIDQTSLMVKTPAEYIVDNLQNFVLNIGNLYMYIVSTIVNMPNSSLENIIPEKDGCKIIFGDKLTCKKKFKCLFKKCSMLEDPTGYMIEKSKANSQSGGGVKHLNKDTCKSNSGTSCKEHPNTNYDADDTPLILSRLLKGEKGISLSKINDPMRNIAQMFSNINKIQHVGGGSTIITNDENDSRNQTRFLYNIINEKMKTENIFKMLVLIKMMKIVYGELEKVDEYGRIERDSNLDEIIKARDDKDAQLFLKENREIQVPFPFRHALFDMPSKKVEVLLTHLTGKIPDNFDENPNLKQSLLCKNCTVHGQSMKIFNKLYRDLVQGVNKTFGETIKLAYDLFKQEFIINGTPYSSTFILQFIQNYKLNSRVVNIFDLKQDITDNVKLYDSLLMMPNIMLKSDSNVQSREDLKLMEPLYKYLVSMKAEEVLVSLLYKRLYLDVASIKFQNKRLFEMKKNVRLIAKVLQPYHENYDSLKAKINAFDNKIGSQKLSYLDTSNGVSNNAGILDLILDNKKIDDTKSFQEHIEFYKVIYNIENEDEESIILKLKDMNVYDELLDIYDAM